MDFCPKCKSLLVPSKGKLVCSSCKYSKKPKGPSKIKEEIKQKQIEIIEGDIEYGDSTIPVVCWNCGHKGVYVKINYYRSDEAPIRMYKCEKCKKVWRSSR
jgi:transcription factor S